MANENDHQPNSSHHHHNASDLQAADGEKGENMPLKSDADMECGTGQCEDKHDALSCNVQVSEADSENMPHSASQGKPNDLVADLCLNGHRPAASYGDYTSARPAARGEGYVNASSSSSEATGGGNVSSTHAASQSQPTQNSSSFSFKHFLSSSSAHTAPSTTVTSLDPPSQSSSNTSTNSATSVSSSGATTRSKHTSTGARPKVPQSNSVTTTSISSLVGGSGGGGGLSANAASSDGQSGSATKMKRSPRFSSFDSQASLAEYAGSSASADIQPTDATRPSDYRLYAGDERDRFAEWTLPTSSSTMTTNSSDYERGSYVPRSYSNYDMPRPQTSPRRRVNVGSNRDARPNRLTLNSNSNTNSKMAIKLKLDLPINQHNNGANNGPSCSAAANANANATGGRKKPTTSRSSDFQASNPLPGGAAAAALPDFVQDHWMESWYANDMQVNSPSTSPPAALADELPAQAPELAAGNIHRLRNLDHQPLPAFADVGGGDGFPMSLPDPAPSTVGSKMLPDFLSDGPIMHSSQRLADIATGLPSNSVGSPEDSNMTTHMSRLRLDNSRLQRELNEARSALNEQTQRANNLERQLVEQQRQHKTESEETSDSNQKQSAAAQSQMLQLKQQVQRLTAEVELLRREKELMREEGAVGGCSESNCDRSSYAAAAAAAVTSSNRCSGASGSRGCGVTPGDYGGCLGVSSSTNSNSGVAAHGIRPSRSQQLSRDLRRAASNAEQNLRQLLAGVDNLRQMAANIEKSETPGDYDASPDLFSDFLDDCDEYDEYPGGPAL